MNVKHNFWLRPLETPEFLWRPVGARAAYALAAFIGFAFALYMFPKAFFFGHSGFFEESDPYQHITAWMFYARDSWHFPLMYTERLNHPAGMNVGFADIIPLAAMFFKLFAPWLPNGFHYFGWWYLLVFVAQAMAGTFLIRALGLRHLAAVLVTSLMLVFWPTLLNRVAHAALMSHFLVLLSLAFYFLGRSGQWSSRKAAWAMVGLVWLSLLIHPYFVPMLGGLLFAYLLDEWISKGHPWRQVIPLISCLVGLGVLSELLGYLGEKSVAAGYNYYAMNLNALFCGNGLYLRCVFGDGPSESFEAYNYLGAGMLALLPVVLVLSWRSLLALPRRYPGLLLLLLGFLAYGLTNIMYFGSAQVLAFPMPDFMSWITGTFRMGGRFVWPLGYLILLGSIWVLLKNRSPLVLLLLVLGIGLQWADGQPLRQFDRQGARKAWKFDPVPWEPLLKNVSKIYLYPTYGCGPNGAEFVIGSQHLAGHFGLLLNTGDSARREITCERDQKDMGETPKVGAMYLMAPAARDPFNNSVPVLFQKAAKAGECYEWNQRVVCLPGVDKARVLQSGLVIAPYQFPDHPLVIWRGGDLPTQTGLAQEGFMVHQTPKMGWLHAGPFVGLPPGHYRARLRYFASNRPSELAATTELAFSETATLMAPAKVIRSNTLMGTQGAMGSFALDFQIDDTLAHQPLNLRSRVAPHVDFRLQDLYLERLP